ncbi:MAG: hypothetical protein L0387_31685 [Acidobacteria bacterium]|nr:hypothetical protein [Acidobacteriota bacterium]MCI0626156.1 hypothetical protein [Acidobacteriota bacterium]MCI0724738.1 hypothetical protein [Acidobacteriota bacterium]
MTRLIALLTILLALESVSAGMQPGNNAVIPGEFIVEPATLMNLGFEWRIQGDDNRNAKVAVQYRKQGQSEWKEALPLLRIGDEKVWRAREYLEYWTPRMFAGSILDLEEETSYECRFTMSDPDGVQGQAAQQATVATRGVPKIYSGGRTLHVYPPDYQGPREQPAFNGLKEAYYGPGTGDWNVVRERPVQPGDVILVHAGLYKADRSDYVTPYSVPFDGTYVLTIDGTPEKPIVVKGAGDGEAIFDGNGCFRLFDVMAADYNYFQGITIRNTDIAFYAGLKDVLGSSGLVVRNCRMEDVGIGITTEYAGSKNFYIADNVFVGRDDRHRLIGWASFGKYKPHPVKSYYGVKVYGQGHVICHNSVAYFHDGICVSTYGTPPKAQHEKPVAIDIYNNDIHVMVDDFIEADGGVHNVRVMRNRGFNAAQHGLSAQPVFGGPTYFYRNIVYNVPMGGAIKNGGANPAGVLIYHNTFVAENSNVRGNSNMHYRNNLIMGTDHPEKPVLGNLTYTSYSSLDYNGYRPNRSGRPQYAWKSPAAGTLRDYSLEGSGYQEFPTLAEFRSATGQEQHGREVDYDIFVNVHPPHAKQPHAIYESREHDFRLRQSGLAVDAGCRLPNINDAFAGSAPDLGALELGQSVPIYGPRQP